MKEIRFEYIHGKVKLAGVIEEISRLKYKHRKETKVFHSIEKKTEVAKGDH